MYTDNLCDICEFNHTNLEFKGMNICIECICKTITESQDNDFKRITKTLYMYIKSIANAYPICTYMDREVCKALGGKILGVDKTELTEAQFEQFLNNNS